MDRVSLALSIEKQKSYYARLIIHEQWRAQPRLAALYGEEGFKKSEQDAESHLAYLAQALALDHPQMFFDYLEWVKILFYSMGLSTDGLKENLMLIRDYLCTYFLPEGAPYLDHWLTLAIEQLEKPLQEQSSYLDPANPFNSIATQLLDVLLQGDRSRAFRLIQDCIAAGMSVQNLYLRIFEPCQREVGRLWHTQQIGIAQEHFCTASIQSLMAQLYPLVAPSSCNGRQLLAVCVGRELHDIGLRMVSDFLQMQGWQVHYLGHNTPNQAILEYLDIIEADLVAISTTIPTHLWDVEELIRNVRKTKGKDSPKILVGGSPFNLYPELWQKIGADGFASNAEQAVVVANQLLNS
jgi:methanogenic corrinoid protein MtbC1